jgi:hypothetical protein
VTSRRSITNIPTVTNFFPARRSMPGVTCATASVISICRMIIYGQELQVQLQKSRQTNFVALGKKFITDGIFIVLYLEATTNCNCDTSHKPSRVRMHFYIFGFNLPLLNECIYPLEVVKLLLKHPALVVNFCRKRTIRTAIKPN